MTEWLLNGGDPNCLLTGMRYWGIAVKIGNHLEDHPRKTKQLGSAPFFAIYRPFGRGPTTLLSGLTDHGY